MSIFPESDFGTSEIEKEKKVLGYKEPLFDFETGKMIIKDGKVVYGDKKKNIEQWIRLLILTQVDKFKVYQGANFGMLDLYNLIGNNYLMTPYGIAELERELKEKISEKNGVDKVINIEVQPDFNKVNIKMTVLVDGQEIETEGEYNVI